jgi:Uma2 family endonuclease
MEAIVEQMLHYPQVHLYLQQVQDALREEQGRRKDFHDSLSDDTHAKFINGEIVSKMPLKRNHFKASGLIYKLMDTSVQKHDLSEVLNERALISLTRNDYEPDICFWTKAKSEEFEPGQTIFPAPDFIVEIISESTEKRDRGIEFQDYAAHGVNEYWIMDTERRTVEQYMLVNGQYDCCRLNAAG